MSPITHVKDVNDLEAMFEASSKQPVVLFKHSNACPVSAQALGEFDRLNGAQRFMITVQHAREASNVVEERLGVRHETPQAIVIRDGQAAYSASHRGVSADDLSREIEK